MSNFYEVLGLAVGAKPEDIKATFHKLAKSSHPDINADDSTAEERFKEVNQAYEILSDSEKRAAYDLGLKHKLAASHRRWQIAMAAACLVVTLACGLSVFIVSQYYLSQESTGKVTQQVAELTNLLSLEKGNGKSLEDDLATLQASLSFLRADNERLSGVADLSGGKDARIAGLTKELDVFNDALARIDPLQRQIAALNEALVAAQSKDKESRARISYLSARLNVVLARQVQELQRSVAGEAGDRSSSARNLPAQPNQPSEALAQRYHSMGMERLRQRDVKVARLFFQRAAETGLKESMRALASTYDPEQLAKLGVVGTQPDVREARKWYENSGDLGAIAAMEAYLRASVVRDKIAADLFRFHTAYASGEGLAYVVINEATGEEVYRYGDVSRSKFKKDPHAYTLFECDTPHILTSQKAEDISRLLKATVVTPSDRRFAELQAKYLSACTNSPAKSAKRMDPPDASGRAAHADAAETLAQVARKISEGDLEGAREILQEHLGDDSNGRVTFALAETYDPNMLASWGSTAVADTKRARILYHKSFELGVSAAKMRLEALE